MGSPYLFDYRGSFRFDLEPAELWAKLGQTERYPEWWPWMRDLETRGTRFAPGFAFRFKVVSPLPWKMALTITVTDSDEPVHIEAKVDGHLRGPAELTFSGNEDGTTEVGVTWSVEVMDRTMRVGARVARPLIKWGQDWAVRTALTSFQKHLVSEESAKRGLE